MEEKSPQGYEFHLTFFILARLGQLEDFVHAPGYRRFKVGVIALDSSGLSFEVSEEGLAFVGVPGAHLMPTGVADEAGPKTA